MSLEEDPKRHAVKRKEGREGVKPREDLLGL